ncbi:hypothetical protein Bbelb_239240 [Branchiostoma belcheri]|nr:hypothetical protein Bbelb_239240 [Branchiostoma belcheri]
MRSVLERPDLQDDEKATLYQQLLQRYLTYRDKRRTEPVTVRVVSSSTPGLSVSNHHTPASGKDATTSGKDEQDILDAFPKTMKSRARQILNVIKHKGGDVISYDDQGQLLFNNRRLANETRFQPRRVAVLCRGLASINAPEAAIRNPMRLSVIHRHKSRAAKGEELSDSDDIPTPIPPRRRAAKRTPQARQKFTSRIQLVCQTGLHRKFVEDKRWVYVHKSQRFASPFLVEIDGQPVLARLIAWIAVYD